MPVSLNLSLGSLVPLLLACCVHTGDLSRHESELCEVHGRSMSVQTLRCSPGNSCYRPDYQTAMREQFPHHAGQRFEEDHGYFTIYGPVYLSARVCSDCARNHDEWLKAHPGR